VRAGRRRPHYWIIDPLAASLEVFRRTGSVDHGSRQVLEPFAAALDEAGASYEWLTPAEAANRWPGLRFDQAVLFQPDGGVAHPDNTVTLLQRAATAHGAEWHTHTKVDAIEETPEGVRVRAADRTFTADQVVLTAGVWSHQLADLPTDIAIQVQPSHFVATDPATPWPTFIHRWADEHGRPMPEAYGLPSPDGIKVGFHGGGKVVDPDDRDFTVVDDEVDSLRHRQPQCVGDRRGLDNDLDPALVPQKTSQTGPVDRMVLDDKHPRRCHWRWLIHDWTLRPLHHT
jgi:sarcosine oxidase